MALNIVVDPDTVIQRMSLKDGDDVQNAVAMALTTAHALVQGILCTTFEKTTHSDEFKLVENMYPTHISDLLSCRLRQGFVHKDTIVVKAGELRLDLATGTALTEGTDYIVDEVRGYVQVGMDYAGQWVQVAYTAGFDTTHKAPDWLVEAIMAYMPYLLMLPSSSMDAAAVNAAQSAEKMAWNIAAKITEPYLRNKSFQYSPI